jgi:hypothetical protein
VAAKNLPYSGSDVEAPSATPFKEEDQIRFTPPVMQSVLDSPVYVFQAEPHRPGSFRTVGSTAEETPEYSPLFIGQISGNQNAGESRPRELGLVDDAKVKIPIPSKLRDLGIGQFASTQGIAKGKSKGAVTRGLDTAAPQLASGTEKSLAMRSLAYDKFSGLSSARSASSDFLISPLCPFPQSSNNKELSQQGQSSVSDGAPPSREPDETWRMSNNMFLSFASEMRPIRSVRTAEAALCSLAEDSDE